MQGKMQDSQILHVTQNVKDSTNHDGNEVALCIHCYTSDINLFQVFCKTKIS